LSCTYLAHHELESVLIIIIIIICTKKYINQGELQCNLHQERRRRRLQALASHSRLFLVIITSYIST